MHDFTTIAGIERFMAGLRAAYEDLVGGISQTARQRIRDAVATYATDLLPRIDQRLLHCDALLRQGLREEALGHAAEEPNLAAAADHMNLERFGSAYRDWMEASRAAGILPPVPPRMEFVRNLRDAEQSVTTLGPLLTRWRRMNIAREPLSRRIRILRELRAQDGTNPVWPEVLKAHEEHRLMQIKASVSRLREMCVAGNAAIADADRELEGCIQDLRGPWTTLNPPAGLEESAVAVLAAVRSRRIDKRLDQVVADVTEAFAAVEAHRTAATKDRLKAVWREWRRVLAEKGAVSADDPRLTLAKPADEYVERLTTYETRVAEVAQSLNERPATFRGRVAWSEAMDRMIGEIEDVVSRLPPADIDGRRVTELSQRVAAALDDVRREIWFRRVRMLAAAAAVLVLIAGAAFTAVALARHERFVAAAVAEVDALRARALAGDPSPLPDFTARYVPSLRDDPRLASAIAALAGEITKQDSRREQFTLRTAQVEKLIDAARASDRSEPLAQWPPQFAEASQAIDAIRGESLVLTSEDKARVDQLEKSMVAVAKGFSEAAGDAFLVRVKKLEAELIGADAALSENPDRVDAVLQVGEAEFASLRRLCDTPACPGAAAPYADRQLISRGSKSQVESDSKLMARLNELRARRELLAGLGARESRADAFLANGAYGAYADILRELAKSIGNDTVGRDYARVADDVALWQAMADWNAFVADLGPLGSVTAAKAKSACDARTAWKPEMHALSCVRESADWLPKFLEQRREMTPEKVIATQSMLEKILKSKYGTQVDGVVYATEETAAGDLKSKLFYCLRKDRPVGTEPTNTAYVIAWPDARGAWDTKRLRFDPKIYAVEDSPQKQLATACLKLVESLASQEAVSVDAATKVVEVLTVCGNGVKRAARAESPALDPLLHAILLRYVLLETVKVHPMVQTALAPALRMAETGKDPKGEDVQVKDVDNSLFEQALNPETQHAGLPIQDARRQCSAFIREVREGAERASKALRGDAARVDRAAVARFEVAGRLRRQRDGGWWISGGVPEKRGGKEVFVLHRAGSDANLDAIGVCDERGQISAGTKVAGRAGDPVFLRISTGKQEAKGDDQ
jgi:hypothetical protein